MATTTEKCVIVAMIVAAIVTVVATRDDFRFRDDPVVAHYKRIQTECAKPMPDGRRRSAIWLTQNNDGKDSYVLCP